MSHEKRPVTAPARDEDRDVAWARAFLAVQILCQLALLSPFLGSFRVFFRALTFVSSLFLLVMVARRGKPHPAERAALVGVGILFLELFHPTTNGLVSGTAQLILNLAILAPIYWASRFALRVRDVRNLVLVLWLFHVASSGAGILQTMFPGRFQPNISTVLRERPEYLEALSITLSSGERVPRPMGLTDIPGGAANAGFYTILFGLAFLIIANRPWWKAFCAATLVVAMTCIYLCQVRAMIIRLGICLVSYVALLVWRGRIKRFGLIAVASAVLLVVGYLGAFAIGGKNVVTRYDSLFTNDASDLYYKNRGIFLEDTFFEELPHYPLGAGLGRHGMMNAYFGEDGDPAAGHLHVEIQFTAWIYDGGLPLTIAYLAAMGAALWFAWQTSARTDSPELQLWGGLLFAYNIGTLALCFSYAVFSGQSGIEFWFMNGIVYAASVRADRAKMAGLRERLLTGASHG